MPESAALGPTLLSSGLFLLSTMPSGVAEAPRLRGSPAPVTLLDEFEGSCRGGWRFGPIPCPVARPGGDILSRPRGDGEGCSSGGAGPYTDLGASGQASGAGRPKGSAMRVVSSSTLLPVLQ